MNKKYFNGLMIEPTNICNLNCPLCMAGSGLDKRPKGSMNFRQFKEVVSPAKDFLEFIYLWGWGEPFLAPDIMEMIDYVGKKNIVVDVHTNGTVLNKKIMDQFRGNPKVKITFSIDGATQKTYGYYRRGGQLREVLKNLSYLIKLKEKYKLSSITIIWQFLIMRTNEREISTVCQMAEEIGVDKLRLKTIGIGKKHPQYNDFMPDNRKYYRERKQPITRKECEFINPGCPYVLWNGDVTPCCHDYTQDYLMGNALGESLLGIWQNKKYSQFRKDYRKNINTLCNTKCKFKKTSQIYFKEFTFK